MFSKCSSWGSGWWVLARFFGLLLLFSVGSWVSSRVNDRLGGELTPVTVTVNGI